MNERSTVRVAQMRFFPVFVACVTVLLASPGTRASVASDAVRTEVGGIDVVALRTSVQDVVNVVGSLPAGDDRSPTGDVMLATLTGAMLDKGTTAQDKFAIAQKLGGVGATLTKGAAGVAAAVAGSIPGDPVPTGEASPIIFVRQKPICLCKAQ